MRLLLVSPQCSLIGSSKFELIYSSQPDIHLLAVHGVVLELV